MKIKVLAHGNTDPEKVMLLYKTVKFYAKYLKINNAKYTLYVCSAPHLRKTDGNYGIASKTGHREISVAVDSKLQLPRILLTLAHEMVHVKQFIKGHYRSEPSRNGKLKKFWLGKQYSVEYSKRPWEIEAFRRENELFFALIDFIVQKEKNT